MMVRTLLLSGLASLLAVSAGAQSSARTAVELDRLGPQVGQRVPDFSLTDQDGERRDLKSVLGPNGGLLVFFRSADW